MTDDGHQEVPDDGHQEVPDDGHQEVTDDGKLKCLMDDARIYQIKVQGSIDERWSEWFNGLSITALSDPKPVTILTGLVIDQSSLRGIMSKIWDLNLIVISIEVIDPG